MATTYNGAVELGLLLRKTRRGHGLSTEELGHVLGASQGTVSKWENGRRPGEQYWKSIADFLGTTEARIAELLFFTDHREVVGELPDLDSRVERLEANVSELRDLLSRLLDRLDHLDGPHRDNGRGEHPTDARPRRASG